MNENLENRPYKELPQFDIYGRHGYTDGWEHPRDDAPNYAPPGLNPRPVGPGTFPLPFIIHRMIKAIEVEYEFMAGREAEIQAAEEGAPRYKISAPGGFVIIPVGKARQWVIHLPAGTQVRAYIDKWQYDLEAMAREPWPAVTPESLEEGRRALDDMLKRRKQG